MSNAIIVSLNEIKGIKSSKKNEIIEAIQKLEKKIFPKNEQMPILTEVKKRTNTLMIAFINKAEWNEKMNILNHNNVDKYSTNENINPYNNINNNNSCNYYYSQYTHTNEPINNTAISINKSTQNSKFSSSRTTHNVNNRKKEMNGENMDIKKNRNSKSGSLNKRNSIQSNAQMSCSSSLLSDYTSSMENIAGYLIYSKKDSIIKFAVNPSLRNLGIGQQLLSNSLERMTQQMPPSHIIHLAVDTKRFPAQHLYGKAGFKVKQEIKDYYEPGRDAYLMEYCLKV